MFDDNNMIFLNQNLKFLINHLLTIIITTYYTYIIIIVKIGSMKRNINDYVILIWYTNYQKKFNRIIIFNLDF